MDVIPVIDVRMGVAVKAIAGDRANYKPLATPLCEGSDPRAVLDGLMALHPFPLIYLADLDGIEGRGANLMMIGECVGRVEAALSQPRPDTLGTLEIRRVSAQVGASTRPTDAPFALWVDTGARSSGDVAALLKRAGVCCVIGSETGIGPEEFTALDALFPGRLVLSLDFRADGYVGDPALLADPARWPSRVIAMTLAKVGGGQGPDLGRITDLKQRAGDRLIYAAGGIRNRADLDAAAAAGAAGALISSALHAQTITAADLRSAAVTG